MIVTLGRHSMQRYFPGESIGRIHGTPRRKDGQVVVPMYHPAAALHQASLRKVIQADFARLPEFLKKTLAGEDAAEPPVPAHLAKTAAAAPAPAPPPSPPEAQQMRLL